MRYLTTLLFTDIWDVLGAAKHPPMHRLPRPAPQTERYLVRNVSSVGQNLLSAFSSVWVLEIFTPLYVLKHQAKVITF